MTAELVTSTIKNTAAWFCSRCRNWCSPHPGNVEIDGEFITEPRVDKTISRIWRDTRYTHDPSLYRENMWIIFKRGRMHTTEFPGIYFEITPDGFGYGCGFYHASTSYMNTLRKSILEAPRFSNCPGFLRPRHLPNRGRSL